MTEVLARETPFDIPAGARRLFEIFWSSYVGMAVSGILLIISYLTGGALNLVFLFKIPLVTMLMVIFIFHTVYPVMLSAPALLFCLGGAIGISIGALHGTLISNASLTHLYATVMPVAAMSFGSYFARWYDARSSDVLARAIRAIFIVNTAVLCIYFYYFYIAKKIAYFGFDSVLALVSVLFLAQRRYWMYLLCVVLVLLSGKRAPLLTMLVPAGLLLVRSVTRPTLRTVLFSIMVIVVSVAGVHYAYQSGMLYRFDALLSLDVSDYSSLYRATSGRSDEFTGLWNHMQAEPSRWWVGSGFGGRFLMETAFAGQYTMAWRHYLHFSLFTYLLMFGAPFTLMFLVLLGRIFWRNRSRLDDFFFMAMVVTFVGAFFGASLIVEPVFWFFLGINARVAALSAPMRPFALKPSPGFA